MQSRVHRLTDRSWTLPGGASKHGMTADDHETRRYASSFCWAGEIASSGFDRTPVALSPRRLAIGFGRHAVRLATIHSQPHDVPIDLIVTEIGVLMEGKTHR